MGAGVGGGHDLWQRWLIGNLPPPPKKVLAMLEKPLCITRSLPKCQFIYLSDLLRAAGVGRQKIGGVGGKERENASVWRSGMRSGQARMNCPPVLLSCRGVGANKRERQYYYYCYDHSAVIAEAPHFGVVAGPK